MHVCLWVQGIESRSPALFSKSLYSLNHLLNQPFLQGPPFPLITEWCSLLRDNRMLAEEGREHVHKNSSMCPVSQPCTLITKCALLPSIPSGSYCGLKMEEFHLEGILLNKEQWSKERLAPGTHEIIKREGPREPALLLLSLCSQSVRFSFFSHVMF